MKNLFEHTSAPWIRYSNYEYKTDNNDNLYITVSKDAKPEMYRPMQKAGQLVMDAVNVGLAAMHKVPEEELKESVLGFVRKYGFLGFMPPLPADVLRLLGLRELVDVDAVEGDVVRGTAEGQHEHDRHRVGEEVGQRQRHGHQRQREAREELRGHDEEFLGAVHLH